MASAPPSDRLAQPCAVASRYARNRTCQAIADLVARALQIPPAELSAATRRTRTVAMARQAAMYLARVGAGLSYRDIAKGFGRDPRSVIHACRKIEDRRDDPRVDAFLAGLERACMTIAAAPAGGEP